MSDFETDSVIFAQPGAQCEMWWPLMLLPASTSDRNRFLEMRHVRLVPTSIVEDFSTIGYPDDDGREAICHLSSDLVLFLGMNNLFHVYRPPKRLYKSLRIYQLLRVYKLLVRCRTVRMTSFSTRKSLLAALTTIQSLLGIRSRILLLSLLLALVLALMVSLLLLLLLSHPLGLHYHSRLISINNFWIYLGGRSPLASLSRVQRTRLFQSRLLPQPGVG